MSDHATPDPEFQIDYWKVSAALARFVNEARKDFGDDVASSMINLLTIELQDDYPQFDWANVMTDSWPING